MWRLPRHKLGTIFPERLQVKLPYLTWFALNGLTADYAEFLISTASIFDPDISTTGRNGQPRGRDQWFSIYNRYQVTRFTASIKGAQQEVDTSTTDISPLVVGSALPNSNYTPTSLPGGVTQLLNILEATYQPAYSHLHYKVAMAPTNTNSANLYSRRITLDPRKEASKQAPEYAQQGYTGIFTLIGADPTYLVPLSIFIGRAANVNMTSAEWVFQVRCVYTVTFLQPNNIAYS